MKKKLKPYLVLLLLLISGYLARPQQGGTSSLTGQVLDESHAPLPHITVTLHKQLDSTIAKIGVSDEKGGFTLQGLSGDQYFIRVDAMGHQPYISGKLIIETENNVNLEPIVLKPSASTLETVNIVASRPLIEMKADRTVVHVDQLLAAQGSSAWELLQQAPGVMASGDGAISIHGIQSVLVIIDGKQTHLSGNELAEHLQSLPADQIHQVEVISRPSAKYDAAGIGGVINLRTKKGLTNGLNASFTLGARQGRYFNSTNNFDVNWKQDNVYAFANISYALGNPLIEFDQSYEYKDASGGIETVVKQHFISESTTSTPNIRTGLDYTAVSTSFGFAYNANLKGYPAQHNVSHSEILDPHQQLLATNVATRTRELRNPIHSISGYMDQRLGKKGASLSVVADYLNYDRPLNYLLSNNLTPTEQASDISQTLIQQINTSKINVYGIKADYETSLPSSAVLRAGIKSTLMEMDNDAVLGIQNPASGQYETDASRSPHYLFNEHINAAYVDYSQQWGSKWALQAGLRMENTRNTGREVRQDETFKNRNTQLFPSIMLQYRPDGNHGLGLSYNRRIDRPNYEYLIPYAFYTDLLYYQSGNPELLPTIGESLSLSHIFANKLSTSLTYIQTRNSLIQTLNRQPDVSGVALGFGNIQKLEEYSLSISYMKPIAAWYDLVANFAGLHNHFRGQLDGEQMDATRFSAVALLTNQFRLPKSWAVELSGYYISPMQVNPFSVSERRSRVNITVAKQVLNNQGSIRLQVIDLFNDFNYVNRSTLSALNSQVHQQLDSRMIGLSFSYRFGVGQRQVPSQPESSTTEETGRL